MSEAEYYAIEYNRTSELLLEVICRRDSLNYIRVARKYELPPEDTADEQLSTLDTLAVGINEAVERV